MKIINKISNYSQFLLSFSLFIGLGITKIINSSLNDSWICIIIGTIMGLIINYLITKLPNKDNKISSLILNIFLLLIGLLSIIKLVSSVYLNKTNTLLLIIPFCLLILYTSLKDNYALFKVSNILWIIYILFSLFAFLALVPYIKIDYFKPILINPFNKILLGSLEYSLYSTIPLLILPNYQKEYNYKVYLISSICILIIFILLIGNLGIDLAKYYRYPEYILFKNISILHFIENIENVLFFIWIINIYVLTSHSALNIKNILNTKWLLFILISMIIIINKYLINNYLVFKSILKYFDYALIILLIIYIISKLFNKKTYT